MSVRKHPGLLDCVAIDLNTQFDFCDVDGAYPVANASQLVLALRSVMRWAVRNNVPVVSSLDSHRRWEIAREDVPTHCVDGTPGQCKLDFTLLDSSRVIEGDNTLWVPIDLFQTTRQVIFRKRTRDFFANPKADRFLTQLQTHQYVVFGNGIENSIKNVALGLLARHRRVCVVVDACGYWDKTEAELAVRQMEAKGVELLTVQELDQRVAPAAGAVDPLPPSRSVDSQPRHPLLDSIGNGTIPQNGRAYANGNGRSHGNGNGKSNGRGHLSNGHSAS